MKKLLLVLTILFSISCSSDDEKPVVLEAEWEVKARQLLVGSWHGELFSSVTNSTECEDIVFIPFEEKQEKMGLSGKIQAYGVAEIEHYFNDHLLQTEQKCLFTVLDYDSVEGLLIAFYPCNEKNEIIGREDKRVLFAESLTKFYMRKYGLTKENNLTYTKQN